MSFTPPSLEERVWTGLLDPDFLIREEWATGHPLTPKQVRFLFEDSRFGAGFVLQRVLQRRDIRLTPPQEATAFKLFPDLVARRASFEPDDAQWAVLLAQSPECAALLIQQERVTHTQLTQALTSEHSFIRAAAVRAIPSLSPEEAYTLLDDSEDVVIGLMERADFCPTKEDVHKMTLSLADKQGVLRSGAYFAAIEDQLPFWNGTQARIKKTNPESELLDWSLFTRPDAFDDDF